MSRRKLKFAVGRYTDHTTLRDLHSGRIADCAETKKR
jgi:hypothetical protein